MHSWKKTTLGSSCPREMVKNTAFALPVSERSGLVGLDYFPNSAPQGRELIP